MADNYYGVTHPSMPNHLASIGGDNFGIQDDNDQNVVNLDRRNLVDQLEARQVRWDAYVDTLPANELKHNPFVLFNDIKNDPARMSHVRDYTQLAVDLNAPDAPQFVWISPNQCNDMHGGVYVAVPGHAETQCPYGSTKDDPNDAALKQKADAFVHGAVDTIRHSKAWTRRSAIVIVTDENDYTGGTYGGGLIPAIVVTAHGPRHAVDHTAYDHYSLLTTIEDNWRLGHLGHAGDTAGGVVPMWPLFTGHD